MEGLAADPKLTSTIGNFIAAYQGLSHMITGHGHLMMMKILG